MVYVDDLAQLQDEKSLADFLVQKAFVKHAMYVITWKDVKEAKERAAELGLSAETVEELDRWVDSGCNEQFAFFWVEEDEKVTMG